MTLDQLKQKVRYKINEIVPDAETRISLSALVRPVDVLIEEALIESVVSIFMDVPAYRIVGISAADGSGDYTFTVNPDLTVTVTMPTDAVKIKKAKLTSWEKQVYENINPFHPIYKLQLNAYVRGDKTNPVVSQENPKEFTMFSADSSDDTVEVFEYIGKIAPETVQDDLVDILCYRAGAMFLTTVGSADSEAMWAVYKSKVEAMQ